MIAIILHSRTFILLNCATKEQSSNLSINNLKDNKFAIQNYGKVSKLNSYGIITHETRTCISTNFWSNTCINNKLTKFISSSLSISIAPHSHSWSLAPSSPPRLPPRGGRVGELSDGRPEEVRKARRSWTMAGGEDITRGAWV